MEEVINAITWEHLVFVFSIIFIFVFREPVSYIIRRITKIDTKGVVVGSTPEAQNEVVENTTEVVQQLLDVIGNSIVINEQEELIQSQLAAKGLPYDSDTEKILIKHLAGTQILLEFERIHSLIFGSQIYLLKKLNEVSGQGRSAEFISGYVQKTMEINSKELGDWTEKKYLKYLYNQLLIRTDNKVTQITNMGVEYLTWMVRNGVSDDKPL